jgi:hypothetical protein
MGHRNMLHRLLGDITGALGGTHLVKRSYKLSPVCRLSRTFN